MKKKETRAPRVPRVSSGRSAYSLLNPPPPLPLSAHPSFFLVLSSLSSPRFSRLLAVVPCRSASSVSTSSIEGWMIGTRREAGL